LSEGWLLNFFDNLLASIGNLFGGLERAWHSDQRIFCSIQWRAVKSEWCVTLLHEVRRTQRCNELNWGILCVCRVSSIQLWWHGRGAVVGSLSSWRWVSLTSQVPLSNYWNVVAAAAAVAACSQQWQSDVGFRVLEWCVVFGQTQKPERNRNAGNLEPAVGLQSWASCILVYLLHLVVISVREQAFWRWDFLRS
jgi:hypothetical protein